MSGSSIFTGYNSQYLSLNYNDWKFDKDEEILSIQKILIDNGYKIYSIDNSKEGREMMADLTLPLKKKYFPKNISHANFWTNKEMNKILENIFNKFKVNKKSFFMMWFDCRGDKNTSQHIVNTINIFKKNNFYEDSFLVVTSDHGYPDPNTGLNVKTMKNKGHDMILTEDNIRVPLFIKSKNLKNGINERLTSHIDLFPTILEEINLSKKYSNYLKRIDGKSIFAGDKERIIRTDTRLLNQTNRSSSLIYKNYKAIYYHEDKSLDIYNLKNDPNEINPIKKILNDFNKKLFKKFEDCIKETNEKIIIYHKKKINKNLIDFQKKIKNYKNIIFIGKVPLFIKSIILDNTKKKNIFFLDENNISEINEKFDLSILINEKKNFSFIEKSLIFNAKKISKKIFFYDHNLKQYNTFMSKWIWPIWKYSSNIRFYRDEPLLIFFDLIIILKRLKRRYVRNETEVLDLVQEKLLRDRLIKIQKEKND